MLKDEKIKQEQEEKDDDKDELLTERDILYWIRDRFFPPEEWYNMSWKYYVSFALQLLLIGLVIFAYIDGAMIKKEIHLIEVCKGVPTDWGNEYAKKLFPQYAPNTSIIDNYTENFIKEYNNNLSGD